LGWFCRFPKDEYLSCEFNDSETYYASETSEFLAVKDFNSSSGSEDECLRELNFADLLEQGFTESSEPSKKQAPEPPIDVLFTASKHIKSESSSNFEEAEPIDEGHSISDCTDHSMQNIESTEQEENQRSPDPPTFTTSRHNDSA
jgi:hypothetical protein